MKNMYLVVACAMCLTASATDISDALMIDRVNGYAGQLVKENVMVDGKDCVRYSVMYEAQGAVLIVR